jgi:hypothetical protein
LGVSPSSGEGSLPDGAVRTAVGAGLAVKGQRKEEMEERKHWQRAADEQVSTSLMTKATHPSYNNGKITT